MMTLEERLTAGPAGAAAKRMAEAMTAWDRQENPEAIQVSFRPITTADTEAVVRWRNTDRVRRNFIYQATFTTEGHEGWLENKVAAGDVLQLIICLGETQTPVGSVYFRDLLEEPGQGEYGIFIGEEIGLGKGLGNRTAAAAVQCAGQAMGLKRMILRVYCDNEPARRSYERAGFQREQILTGVSTDAEGKDRPMYLMAVTYENGEGN